MDSWRPETGARMARVLIFYVMPQSGHHAAARALEAAFRRVDPAGTVRCLDLLRVTHPVGGALVQRTYLGVVRRTPELWDALYDSARLESLTRRVRGLVRQGPPARLAPLLEAADPDLILCTQAYPLGVVQAALASRPAPRPALWGVLTDFWPHRFWVQPGPCRYAVPHEGAARRLRDLGVAAARIRVAGIPIHPDMAAWVERPRPAGVRPRLLVMGGGRGLGVRYRTIAQLDRARAAFALDVVTGTNRLLRNLLRLRRAAFRHPLRVRGFSRRIPALLHRADLVISKAGGMTCAETLALGVPMLIVRPLPGQEQYNMEFLTHRGAALHVPRERALGQAVDMLLTNPALLAIMRQNAATLGQPDAAARIARLTLAS